MTRTVYVPASRIERWLDTYATRHGSGPVTVDGSAVVVAGTDGATARLSLLWPGLELGADPVADLLAAVRVRHRLGLLTYYLTSATAQDIADRLNEKAERNAAASARRFG